MQGPLIRYRLHPANRPFVFPELEPRVAHASAAAGAVLAAVLAIPMVARALGLPPLGTVALIVPWIAWMEIVALGKLGERAARSLGWMRLVTNVNLTLGCGISAALPIATGHPETPLWALPVMYACFNALALELEPAIVTLCASVGSVLAAIPVFLASGEPRGSAIGVPLAVATITGIAYHHLAIRTTLLRRSLEREERLRAELEAERAACERARLARDLHDAVGANLTAAAVYADLLAAAPADEPERLAAAIAGVTRQGLAELRSVLEGLAPRAIDLGTFAQALREHARTLVAGTELRVEIHAEEPGATIDPEQRVALLRVFQEAVQNALRHAGAHRLDARIERDGPWLRMQVRDDGHGFDVEAGARGRGLRHIEERAREARGRARIASGATGTTITIELPSAPG